MMIIDSQIHPYAPNTPDRPWLKAKSHFAPESATGDELVAAMDKLGIDGAILVSSATCYGFDPSYVVEVQRKHPGRFAIVARVDIDNPAVDETLAEWKKVPGAVGLRVTMTVPGPDVRVSMHDKIIAVDNPNVERTLRSAARHDLMVNFMFWGNVDVGTAVIDRHPETRFAVDHLAMIQPFYPNPTPANVWADLPKIVELARRPNVVLKVSGAPLMSFKPYPFPDIWDPLARIFDAWGFERCLWGTDWTRANWSQPAGKISYKQHLEPFLLTDRLSDSEKAMLMGGACAKAYRWKPKKG